MKIIMNERKKAKEYLESGVIDNIIQCVYILAKYYRTPSATDDEIYNLINKFLETNFVGYKPDNWKSVIDYQIVKSKNHKLIEIDYIPITQQEIEIIESLKNNRLERLSFTMLVIAKYYNSINENNNNWVNRDFKSIFSFANISVIKDKQCKMINILKDKKMIELSKKIDSLNLNIRYVDNESEPVVVVRDIIDLGNQYNLLVKKDTKYKQCKNCDRYIKATKNKKYCKNCAIEMKRFVQREWIRKKRAEKSI